MKHVSFSSPSTFDSRSSYGKGYTERIFYNMGTSEGTDADNVHTAD